MKINRKNEKNLNFLYILPKNLVKTSKKHLFDEKIHAKAIILEKTDKILLKVTLFYLTFNRKYVILNFVIGARVYMQFNLWLVKREIKAVATLEKWLDFSF